MKNHLLIHLPRIYWRIMIPSENHEQFKNFFNNWKNDSSFSVSSFLFQMQESLYGNGKSRVSPFTSPQLSWPLLAIHFYNKYFHVTVFSTKGREREVHPPKLESINQVTWIINSILTKSGMTGMGNNSHPNFISCASHMPNSSKNTNWTLEVPMFTPKITNSKGRSSTSLIPTLRNNGSPNLCIFFHNEKLCSHYSV